VTYVREGAVTHKDSLGNEGRAEAGDVQVMSAAAGRHGVSGKPAHERTNRVFQLSGAKSRIARDLLDGYRQFEPDPSLGAQKAQHPQNSKCLPAKLLQERLDDSWNFDTISMPSRSWVRSPASETDDGAFAERRESR
jgi:hypothetical protein